MVNLPLVSVLMTVYNREKFISQAIESVLGAHYKNLELIIVDDGSVDNSMKIAEYYAARDSRIKTYYNEKNLGDYPNRNRAASYAKGKYLKYVDSDDYIYPEWFNVMVDAMEKYPDAGLGLNRFVRNSEDPGPFYYSSKEAWKHHFFRKTIFSASPLSAILRRDVFERVRGFSDIRYSGDQDMWFKMTATSGLIIAEHPLAESRDHGDQERSKGAMHYLLTGRNIEKKYLDSASCPLDVDEKKTALHLIDISHLFKILSLISSGEIALAFKAFQSYKIKPKAAWKILMDRFSLGAGFYKKIQRRVIP